MAQSNRRAFVVESLEGRRLLAAAPFSDGFNRADTANIGNGWQNLSGSTGGDLAISSNQVAGTQAGQLAGIYRAWSADSVTIKATLKEESNADGSGGHYRHSLRVWNDGVVGHGYGLRFEQTGTETRVAQYDGDFELGAVYLSFHFGPSIQVEFTVRSDGTIRGTVASGADSTSFGMGGRSTLQSAGPNIAYFSEGPDSSDAPLILPRMDDLSLSEPAPTKPSIITASAPLNVAPPGGVVSVSYVLYSLNASPYLLGASIRPTGTSDPLIALTDSKGPLLNMTGGTNNLSRQYVVPATAKTGSYDLILKIWRDNGNGTIGAGDTEMVSRTLTKAITIKAGLTAAKVASALGVSNLGTHLGLDATQLSRFVTAMNMAMFKNGITTAARQSAFLAQAAQESGKLKTWSEVNGSTKPYAPFYGRGPMQLRTEENYLSVATALGLDGSRPYIDRNTYNIVTNPDLVADFRNHPEIGWDVSAYYWKSLNGFSLKKDSSGKTILDSNGEGTRVNDTPLNTLADKLDRASFVSITRGITGDRHDPLLAATQESSREAFYSKSLASLCLGVAVGETLKKVGSTTITTLDQLLTAIRGGTAGANVTITVLKSGVTSTRTVKLAK